MPAEPAAGPPQGGLTPGAQRQGCGSEHPALAWARTAPLTASDIDCTTTVMLKILDGKCRMKPREKETLTLLYDALKERPGTLFDAHDHALIARARAGMDEALAERIYEQRLIAETMLSRPVMKAYKAMLRAAGLLGEDAAGA